ncbi:gustatory receptor for sugar taste 64f-like isoform X2 [Zootermopsis nevadensis]|uniref:gustatory receptor for sugar taste 64f-like isoform X2 n=1 Tax=Zootermopsis nevadensis TaxID=136037 RepID=UPI000B8E793B|nr:gustatory receptor for sugar taste 64f-like isoform X2 [Zootermopsis nevadensis]
MHVLRFCTHLQRLHIHTGNCFRVPGCRYEVGPAAELARTATTSLKLKTAAFKFSGSGGDPPESLAEILASMTSASFTDKRSIQVYGNIEGSGRRRHEVMTISPQEEIHGHAAVADSGLSSFHRTIAPLTVMAQCFALLPVHGVTAPSPKALRFRWMSARVAYTIAVLFSLLFMVFFCILYILQIGGTFQDALEHFLNEYNNLSFAARHANTTSGVVQQYMLRSHHHLFTYLGYSHACAVFASVAAALATFSWNFMDLFIAVTSIALTDRFRLLNRNLQAFRGKRMSAEFWKQTRERYTSLMYLTDTLNLGVSHVVLLSFGSNLYFICLQLFNSLNPLKNWYERVYFYWSFGFLLLRTATVSLSVAGINDESRLPRVLMYALPSDSYNDEVSRFQQLVTTCHVALTGLSFFSVTRTMLLTMAGTIVTYEIVLVQFSHVNT